MNPSQNRTVNHAINIGLFSNVVLAFLKIGFGIVGHSGALLADGVNSTSDVTYYLVVKVFMFFAGRPPDREHPYGHHQMESIAALSVGAFVITTAIALFWNAVNDLFDIIKSAGTMAPVNPWTLWIALLTIAVKIVLTLYTKNAAVRTKSAAILALARDHRNDIFSAGGAALGIVLSRFGLVWGDPLFGAVVAMVVLSTGIQIVRESSAELMDTVPSKALERQVRDALDGLPGLKAVEEIQAHRFGPYLTFNVTIGVDGSMTVREGDRVASEVEQVLYTRIGLVKRAYVHYHPAVGRRNSGPPSKKKKPI
jgi:cation diffusion facilitator family transporter